VNLHATAIALGPAGVLIQGPSGSGKTSLALAAIDTFKKQNWFATLVADDQCLIEARHGQLIATCPPSLAGLIEMRGLGIVNHAYISAIVVDLIIRLVDQHQIERAANRCCAADNMPDHSATSL
jgi:serine kinase of HPr protein (carbohydrate metabolism regulator)